MIYRIATVLFMPKLFAFKSAIVFFLFLIFSSGLAFAEHKITVKVGFLDNHGIITDTDAVDRKGYVYDILKKIEERSNFKFFFFPYTYKEALKALEQNHIDLFGPELYTNLNAKNFEFVRAPIGKMHGVLASRSKETIYYNNPQVIHNSTVATAIDNPFLSEFNAYLEENNIKVKYIYATRDDYHLKEADYYLTTNITDSFHKDKNALNLPTKNMYLLGSKKNFALNEAISEELNKLIIHENNFLERKYLLYYDSVNLNKKYLTVNEEQTLRGKTFKVGYTIDHEPIQFLNEEGVPDGIAVEILNMLATKHGFNVQYIGYDPSDISVGKEYFDILLSIKDNYKDIYKFYTQTDVYLRLPMVLMLNVKDHKVFDKEDEIGIGLYHYTTLDYSKIKKEFPQSTVYTHNNIQSAFAGYMKGDFNAGLFTTTGAEYVHKLFGTEDTQVIGTEITLPLRLFISKKFEDQSLLALNAAINHLDQSLVNEIVSRQSLNFLPTDSLLFILKENITEIIIASLLIILAIVFFFSHEQRSKRKEIQHIINTDSLTGLVSLHFFRECMKEKLALAEPDEYEIITMDIDYFRIINNTYGFEYGSKTIIAIAEALKESYKGDVLISRIVGDLFVILHKYNEEIDPMYICYKNIVPAIEGIVGENYHLSMSIGTYKINDCSNDVNAIIDRANIARLSGKKEHTFTCRAFDKVMQQAFEKRSDIVFRMEQGLKEKEFNVFFQPKINYQTLRIEGAEALIRWFPRNSAIFYPDEFIPVFEANGFIMNIDFYVFEEVLKFIKAHSEKCSLPVISVNLSGRTLYDSATPFKLQGLLKKHNVHPSNVEVEVTESAILDDDKHMPAKVEELKKIGLTVSMDDFGAGVSSLNRLSSLNIDTIKLDKSFLDYNSQVSKGSIIVENIVKMAKDLDMKIVTEGVETAEQALWLQKIGCHLAQGYYFEKPLSEKAFLDLLTSDKNYHIAVN